MKNLEIRDTEQLISFLYLKDELIHVYDELRFAKNIDYKAFQKVKNRLESLNDIIELYIKKSDNCFQIICLEDAYIEPQNSCELKTNVLGSHLQDTEVVFDGSIPSAGYLELSYEDKDWGTNINVKNNVPQEALEEWKNRGYHYNDPMTTRYFDSGIYQIKKSTVIGVGYSKDKELVKSIKLNVNDIFR